MKDVFQVLSTLPIGLATADMVKKSFSQTQQFVMLWVKGSRPATVSLALLSDEVMSTGFGPYGIDVCTVSVRRCLGTFYNCFLYT